MAQLVTNPKEGSSGPNTWERSRVTKPLESNAGRKDCSSMSPPLSAEASRLGRAMNRAQASNRPAVGFADTGHRSGPGYHVRATNVFAIGDGIPSELFEYSITRTANQPRETMLGGTSHLCVSIGDLR